MRLFDSNEAGGYLFVTDWSRFQHYGHDRQLLWIKNYLNLLDNDEYLELKPVERAVLHDLWLLFGTIQEAHRQSAMSKHSPERERALSEQRAIKYDTKRISRALNMRVTEQHIGALIHAGFLTVAASKIGAGAETPASKIGADPEPRAPARSRSIEQQQKEKEKPPSSRERPPKNGTTPDRPAGWPDDPLLDPAAAAADAGPTEPQLTKLLQAFPDADRSSLTVIQPLAQALPAQTVLELAWQLRGRKKPGGIGLLVDRLRDTIRERIATAAAENGQPAFDTTSRIERLKRDDPEAYLTALAPSMTAADVTAYLDRHVPDDDRRFALADLAANLRREHLSA